LSVLNGLRSSLFPYRTPTVQLALNFNFTSGPAYGVK